MLEYAYYYLGMNFMAKRDNKTDVSHLHPEEKTVLIHLLQEQANLLKEKYKRLEIRFKALEERLAKNSSNSSKPPSSDANNPGKKKNNPKKTASLRKKTGKKPGGQPGHKGRYLEMSLKPDEIISLPVVACGHCHNNLTHAKSTLDTRQAFEIPEPKLWVIAYQAEEKYCKECGYTTSACFPDRITHKTQYGPRVKSLLVYMNQYQLLPFERASEFFETVYGHPISPGTIVNAVNTLSVRLEAVESQIKERLIKRDLIHCDETSINVNGNKHWLHTVGNEQLTHYAIHEKRGRNATEAIGILPEFKGTMIHDHWKSYFTYQACRHGLCNAHHLRELRFLYEHHPIKWAKKLSDLLIRINEHKNKRVNARGKPSFSPYQLKKYNADYDEILHKASKEQARRGTIDSHNLLKRLKAYKGSTLLFMTDFSVPFTNNLSERDIRMMKVKQKISGCFRNKTGGENFCRIRGALSTAKKNKKNIFNVLQEAFYNIISVEDLLVDS